MLNALCKENRLEARGYFEFIQRVGHLPNVATFSILIDGYCKKGRLAEAMEPYELMWHMKVNLDVIVYDCLIHGFCKQGRVGEGHALLATVQKFGVETDLVIFSSLVDGNIGIGV